MDEVKKYNTELILGINNLFNQSGTSDCCFILNNGERISGHKTILGLGSSVLKAMLFGDLKKDEIMISEDPDIFKSLLRYLYGCSIDFNDILHAFSTYICADYYDVLSLMDICESYILSKISVSTACSTLEHLKCFENTDNKHFRKFKNTVESSCFNVIQKNTEDVLKDGDFLKCSSKTICKILDQEINLRSELDLFMSIEKWVQISLLRTEDEVTELQKPNKSEHKLITTEENPTEVFFPPGGEIKKVMPEVKKILYKIRFLSMSAQEFASGPGVSDLLTDSQKLCLLLNICKPGVCKLPEGFTSTTTVRKSSSHSIGLSAVSLPITNSAPVEVGRPVFHFPSGFNIQQHR